MPYGISSGQFFQFIDFCPPCLAFGYLLRIFLCGCTALCNFCGDVVSFGELCFQLADFPFFLVGRSPPVGGSGVTHFAHRSFLRSLCSLRNACGCAPCPNAWLLIACALQNGFPIFLSQHHHTSPQSYSCKIHLQFHREHQAEDANY